MLATIRYTKALGNAALFVRFRDATGQYWDFVALTWVGAEGANTKTFLTEYADADLIESRYQAVLTQPDGNIVAEYVLAADNTVVAEEGVGLVTASILPLVQRALAMMGANRVVDNEVLDVKKRVTSARIRSYDTAANAIAAGVTGLLATYTVTASYAVGGECTMTVTEVLP